MTHTRARVAHLLVAATLLAGACRPAPPPLRVCADPNNLPYSNEAREGFENALADLIAADLGTTVAYTWAAQRRGFVRTTLRAGECDVLMGVPSSFELSLQTRPYYRSSYMFVTQQQRALSLASFDDEALRTLRIGVHIIGDDYANAPPAHALARRGIINNVVGFSVFGDYREPNPPARLIDAVARGDIDVAVAWGPLAGYFAARQHEPLALVPVSPEIDLPFLPQVFDIAIGVRHGEFELRDRLDEVLERRAADIDALLDRYEVPYTRRIRRADASAVRE
jgi:mxaJ protein